MPIAVGQSVVSHHSSVAGIDPTPVAAPHPLEASPMPRRGPGPQLRAVSTAFQRVSDSTAAEAFCRDLAQAHYENFSVVSLLLPANLRQDFCNIYAFCRIADDLGDEIPDRADALAALERFGDALRACYSGKPEIAVFMALRQTIDRHDIPIQPFLDLIDAFEQDQRIMRYANFEQLLDYCRRSANPVGRLVLYVCGYRDERRQALSDFTCTALQLANFWQDIGRDLRDLNRIYIPQSSMSEFAVTEDLLRRSPAEENVRRLIRFEVDRTEAMFAQGDALLPLLDRPVRRHIALFGAGGRAILESIRRQDYDTITRRPVLSAWQKSRLIARAAAGGLLGRLGGRVAE
jgi:squalene synthase HpnC